MTQSSAFDGFTGHVPSLRRYARQLTRCPDRADDLVQECLMRAIGAAGTLEPGRPVRPWLFRILHNVYVSELRRERTRTEQAPDGADEFAGASQHGHMELRNVLDAVHRLPDAQREAISLVALEDLTYAEAADILDIPVGTLMSRLARGREALRRMLDGHPLPQLQVVGGKHAG